MTSAPVPVLLITGPAGVGKTAGAGAVSDLRVPDLAARLDRVGGEDLLVETDGRPVGDVAEDVLRRVGWLEGRAHPEAPVAPPGARGPAPPGPGARDPGVPYRVKAVIRRGGRYLLAVHDNRLPENQGKWTFLGGLIDPPDPSPAAALLRELREELGVAGRVLGEVGRYPYRRDPGPCVVLLADFEGAPHPNAELLALRWFTRDQVEAIGRAGLLHMGFELDAIARAERLEAGGPASAAPNGPGGAPGASHPS